MTGSALASTLGLGALLIVCTSAVAQPLSMYRAGLERPVSTTAIVKDARWSCEGTHCAAPRAATSPDANVCASVARRFGRLTSFSAGDRTFDAGQLERCNAAAAGD